jgi:hypothetical protein
MAVDALWPDGIDGKSVAGPANRHRALAAQAFGINHEGAAGRRRRPRRHHQRGLRAIVRQRFRPQRQRDQSAIGQLRHTSRLVA